MRIAGFVDLQVNGYLGCDFTAPDLAAEDFGQAADKLLAAGSAAFLATVVTAPMQVYERNLPIIAAAAQCGRFRGRVLGIHLEGPFLSREPGVIGAHRPEHTLAADIDVLSRLMDLAGGQLRMLTLSPELPGAERMIRWAAGHGICAACGHTMATADGLARAADAGATVFTHLGNGLPRTVPRHENPIWAALAEDRLAATLITDGQHLPHAVIKSFIRAKGADRIAVVSDAAPPAGMPPGHYRTLGNDCVLEPDGRLHSPTKNCLVGSSSTMLQCMNHLASLNILTADELHAVGLDNPLRLLGLTPADLPPAARAVQYDPATKRFTATTR
jgi:N-acetylglucosamine-6-phosphate deacetylase